MSHLTKYLARWIDDTLDSEKFMKLLLILYLKTKSMKHIDWKGIMLYIIRIIEMLLTGAAGGALVNNL